MIMAAKAERKRSHLAKRQAPRTIEGERMAQTRGVVEVVEGGQGLNGRDPISRPSNGRRDGRGSTD